ncbi:MAG: hypothetical protein IH598_07590 [Bacteroidales bacterium]|nr:hypothetical protein [Bacteroidales bacterium]
MKIHVLLLLMLVLSYSLEAQTSWTGSKDTNWHDSDNWTSGVPTATVSAVIVDQTNDPVISAPAVAKDITVQSFAHLTVASTGSLTINSSESLSTHFLNNGTVENNGAIVIDATGSNSSYGLHNVGTFYNSLAGTIHIDNSSWSAIYNHSTGIFHNAASITFGANASVGSNGLYNNGTFNNNPGGTLNIDNSTTNGIYNETYSSPGTINNYAVIIIGASAGVGSNGILNIFGATFNNVGCEARINIISNSKINNTFYTFTNSGTIIENSTDNSSISSNTGLIQNLNGGTFTVGSGNAAVTTAGHIWKGCTDADWGTTTNWHTGTLPADVNDVIVPDVSIDPVIASGAVITVSNLTVESNAGLTISPNARLTVTNTLMNKAGTSGLVIGSDATGAGSLIHHSSGVQATAKRHIPGWSDAYHGWHFLSSPVADQLIDAFHLAGSGNDFYKWNETAGEWINRTASGGGLNGSFETNFALGTAAYLVANMATSTPSFEGNLNVADVSISGLSSTVTSNYKGWHLLGNPFSSAIKFNQGSWNKTNIGTYAQVWDETNASYKVLAGSQIIPAHNGFMVYTSGSGSLTIPADARLHSDSSWYKNSESDHEILLIARDIEGNTAQETTISFDPNATEGFDMLHDSYFIAGFAPLFYSTSQNQLFARNTLTQFTDELTLQMGFVKNQNNSFVIELAESIADQTLYLVDLKTNNEHRISDSPYYFTSLPGDDPNRFLLKFAPVGLDEVSASPAFQAWIYNNSLFVNFDSGVTQVEVFDLMGRKQLQTQITGTGHQTLPLTSFKGLCLIRLSNNGNTQTIKANINL